MGHEGNYCRCSRPVLLAPADIPLVEYHSSGGGGDGQQQVSLMKEKTLLLNKKKDTSYLLDIIKFKKYASWYQILKLYIFLPRYLKFGSYEKIFCEFESYFI